MWRYKGLRGLQCHLREPLTESAPDRGAGGAGRRYDPEGEEAERLKGQLGVPVLRHCEKKPAGYAANSPPSLHSPPSLPHAGWQVVGGSNASQGRFGSGRSKNQLNG